MPSHSETLAVPQAEQAYAFLTQPPPQKKRGTQQPSASQDVPSSVQSENPRRRSLAAISNWASSVQPGPPAPLSPNKTAYAEPPRPSKSGRRYSAQVAPPSPVTYIPDSPTSSTDTPVMKPDLQAVGYTSVFVQLPKTPPVQFTPDGRVDVFSPAATEDTEDSRMSKRRFRSLSMKPPGRSKSISVASTQQSKPSAAKEKKSKHADTRPPQIAQELALAQFLGGGSVQHHMKQYAEKQAKRSGAKKENGQVVGVTPLWQDGQGGVWRDQEEQWEYTHLLGGPERNGSRRDVDWVQFDEERGVGMGRESSETVNSELDRRRARQGHDAPEFNVDVFSSGHTKPKRRPQPLDIIPPHDFDAAQARQEFLQSSFTAPLTQAANGTSSKKSVMSNVKDIFKSKKNKTL